MRVLCWYRSCKSKKVVRVVFGVTWAACRESESGVRLALELASGGVVAARINLGESSKVRGEQLLSEMAEKGFAEIGDAFVFEMVDE